MRHQLSFPCEGATLAASLDERAGRDRTADRIGRQRDPQRRPSRDGDAGRADRRSGPSGLPFRPPRDRRQRGERTADSENSGPDIRAAIATFRDAAPHMTRIVAFGNCDAASALLLHQPLALEGLIIANPWTYDSGAEEAGDARASARFGNPRALSVAAEGSEEPASADQGRESISANCSGAFRRSRQPRRRPPRPTASRRGSTRRWRSLGRPRRSCSRPATGPRRLLWRTARRR